MAHSIDDERFVNASSSDEESNKDDLSDDSDEEKSTKNLYELCKELKKRMIVV
jgi:hypothetical protein